MGIALEHLQTFVAVDGQFCLSVIVQQDYSLAKGAPKSGRWINDAPPRFPRSLMTFIGKGDSASAHDLI